MGSTWVKEAANFVRKELCIETHILDKPGEELFDGFLRDANGDLWQDKDKCWAWKSHGVDYASDDTPALWSSAWHPSTLGSEAHFKGLIAALQQDFADLTLPSDPDSEEGRVVALENSTAGVFQ